MKVKLMYVNFKNVHESVSYTDIVLWYKALLLDIYTKVDSINFKEKEKNINGNEIPLEAEFGGPSQWGIHQKQGDSWCPV